MHGFGEVADSDADSGGQIQSRNVSSHHQASEDKPVATELWSPDLLAEALTDQNMQDGAPVQAFEVEHHHHQIGGG